MSVDRGMAAAPVALGLTFFRHFRDGAGKWDADGKALSPTKSMTQRKRDSRFNDLVRDWQQPVYGLAMRMLGDAAEADDVTQEVFIRLLRDLDRYDSAREFRPWIYRVATNLILNRIRASKTRRRRETEAAAQRGSGAMDERAEQRETEQAVRASLLGQALLRIGDVDAALASNDRFFRAELAGELQAEPAAAGVQFAPVLQLQAVASARGGAGRRSKPPSSSSKRGCWLPRAPLESAPRSCWSGS